ncbi:MAG: alkene reductase [Cyanobacteria bacterium J06623_7]
MTSATTVPNLLQPLNKGLSLKNRVVMAPMTRGRAGEARIANALMAEYYAQRAGAGLIVSEGTAISPRGYGWTHSPGIYTPEQTKAWQQTIERVHQQESKIYLQLWHTGRASHSSFQPNNQLPIAPSAIAISGSEAHTPEGKKPYETPWALETEEIAGVVEEYRQAAANAKAAGFDGVEIHAANGYLIDEFLQSKTNQRTDKYGGSIENRYRFLQEVIEAVLTVWDAGSIGVRLSPNGSFNDMGSSDYRETFTYITQQLNSCGLAYLHLLDGLAFGFHELGEPMTISEFRKIYDGVLIANCGYDRHDGEKAISEGNADLVAFGRPYISNPDLVERFANNWELNLDAKIDVWYSPGAEGYTDFPTYKETT